MMFSGDASDPPTTYVLDGPGQRPRRVPLPVISDVGATITGDGRKLFAVGGFPVAGGFGFGIGSINLNNGTVNALEAAALSPRFSVSRTGRWIAYTGAPPGAAADASAQILLRDTEEGVTRQLTTSLAAGSETPCNATAPFAPQMSADGTVVVFVAPAPIDADPPTAYGTCRVWLHSIATGTTRSVREIPHLQGVIFPAAVDAVGRQLSFTLTRRDANGRPVSGAALLDLHSGVLRESLTDDDAYQTFDAVVTRDGKRVLLSSMSDLDPRVGNGDHNIELFLYDIAEEHFTQVTNTVGGIEPGVAGTCTGYRPAVSASGDIALLVFYGTDAGETCIFDRPERHHSTGLYYRFARTVRKRLGNRPAELSGLPAIVAVRPEQMLELRAAATDPDGDPITFFAQEVSTLDVPRGAEIEDHYDGRATLRWRPRVEQAGKYTVRFVAFDEGGGETQQDVLIRVGGAGGDDGCIGDCDDDGLVGISELVTAVEAGLRGGDDCAAADGNGDGQVTVDELIGATAAALYGCP